MSVVRHRIEVAAEDEGLRLDQLLARRVSGLSRRKARLLVDLGGVYVDRARVKVASRPVRQGQVVEAVIGGVLAKAGEEEPPPPLVVVHQDDEIVVVDKPAGLITAPTPESDRGNLLDLLSRRGEGPVWLVHRIDRATSGLLVFARTPEANRILGERFARHDIEREYTAVVAGPIPEEPATIDRAIGGKRAVTHIRLTERLPDASLITARLETGRTHQIRIHMAGIGHPILGDAQHGGEVARRYRDRPPRLALHAGVLGFAHPATGAPMRFESPIPPDLGVWLGRLRGTSHP